MLFIKMCPHDTGVLDRLCEFPKLTAVTLAPQMLLGWHDCLTVTESTLESSHLANPGRISGLLPKNLVEIRLQAWTEGEILEWSIESIARTDLRHLKLIEVESIPAFGRSFTPEYAFDTRYPLRPLSFETYMRLYKECHAAGIVLWNCEFEWRRRKVVEAGALELPHLWNDEKFQSESSVTAWYW